ACCSCSGRGINGSRYGFVWTVGLKKSLSLSSASSKDGTIKTIQIAKKPDFIAASPSKEISKQLAQESTYICQALASSYPRALAIRRRLRFECRAAMTKPPNQEGSGPEKAQPTNW